MTRPATLALLIPLMLAPTVATAQDQGVEGEPEKVSNDQPGRPIQMPAASSEAREAFDDFDRFARRGAWERATKALHAIPEPQANRFVDGPDGFIIPVARKRRSALAGLPPEGMSAYRLFHDADARKRLDSAEGPTEQSTLEHLYSAYFFTTPGAEAADRLGDLYFEQGRFDNAADCWLAVLRDRPDSEIPPARTAVKAALALSRSGRKGEAETIRADLLDRSADEVVAIGGRKAKAAEHLRQALGDPKPARGTAPTPAIRPADGPPPALLDSVAAAWRVRFGASVTAGMTPLESTQWESNPLAGASPAVAIEGGTLYANYLGHVFAVDLAGGKMLWRSASFHNLEVLAGQNQQGRMVDARRYAVVAASGLVWSLGRDLKDMNFQATAHLACRRAETGEVVWRSTDLPDYAGMDLVGLPILAGGTLFLAGKTAAMNNGQENTSRQFALAIRPHDGKLLWKTEVGTFREAQQYFYYGMPDTSPQPRLAYRSGSIYLDTHVGVMARLDAESGRLDWGFGYPTEPVQGQSRFFFFGMMQNQGPTPSGPAPMAAGDVLLVKGAKADKLCAVDPDRMKLAWDRPIARSARLIGVDERTVYFGGPELGAVDRETRALKWSTPMPGGSDEGNVLVRPDGLWQFTPRGVFEVDPASGRVRRIFRGDDDGSSGGDLVLTDHWLLAISNRSISAYPRRGGGADEAVSKTRGADE